MFDQFLEQITSPFVYVFIGLFVVAILAAVVSWNKSK